MNGDAAQLFGEAQRLHDAGELDKAADIYRQILKTAPDDFNANFNLGAIRYASGDKAVAAQLYARAAAAQPGHLQARMAHATAALETGDFEGARQSAVAAARLQPDLADAQLILGNALLLARRFKDAAAALAQASDLAPDNGEILISLASAASRAGDYKGAIAACNRALAINANHADAHYNLGKFHQALRDYDLAIDHGRRALALAPGDMDAAAAFYQHLQQACAWAEMETVGARLDGMIIDAQNSGAPIAEEPFVNISRSDDPAQNLLVAAARSRRIEASVSALKAGMPPLSKRDGPLNIGYLSSDFRDHPLSHLMQGFFALHNRARVRIAAYSHGPDDGSGYRRAIEQSCDQFTDLTGMDDEQAAGRIAADGVDILVDLNGHTTGARTEICALRPAPLQISYLGFPGSSGAGFMDYIVGDDIVTPAECAPHFSEKFLRMPDSYYVTNDAEEVADESPGRTQAGLAEEGFVFACFSQSYKIEPSVFQVWLRLLEGVPGSVLWLFSSNPAQRQNLLQEAARGGVDGGRICFAEDRPKPSHLARLGLADLALDTLTYGGHTTTVDALGRGVPVVTRRGNHFASRASDSILTAIGLEDMIAADLDAYEKLALDLARDGDRLQALRARLADNRRTHPLFDAAGFVANLETGFEMAWARYSKGLAPDHIRVARRGGT